MKNKKRIIIGVVLILLTVVGSYTYNYLSRSTMSSAKKNLPIYSVDTDDKSVAITFDVNWAENDHLDEILEVLEKNDVKATFFIMGGWVNYNENNAKKLIEIKEGGHEIGNHSYIHPMFTKISKERIEEEIRKTENIFSEVAGVNSKVFRFPSGDYNDAAVKYVEDMGYSCIQWNVDSVDYKESGEEVEYNRVMKKVKPGAIMLFHNNAKYTPKNLDKIINELTNEGYSFKKISDLIYDNNSNIDENGVQHKNNY